jgi:hypothetical protein
MAMLTLWVAEAVAGAGAGAGVQTAAALIPCMGKQHGVAAAAAVMSTR